MAEKDKFEEIPDALLTVFGTPEFSFEFELTRDRKLIRAEAVDVIKNLQDRGFHLHMPAENEEPI